MFWRLRACAATVSAVLLAVSLATPVAAVDQGRVQVSIDISGYTPGYGGDTFQVWLGCSSLFEPVGINVTTTPLSGSASSGLFDYGTSCWIDHIDIGWAGDLASFEEPQISPAGNFVVGQSIEAVQVDLSRAYNGDQPEWDVIAEFQLDLFSADHAYVNRNGGLTIDGQLWCPDLIGLPVDPYFGISWTATQYVGRKGAITAEYQPAIAHECYSPATGNAMPWATKGPGTQDKTMWVYAPNGKFGAGMVHVEIRTGGEPQELVTQWWDESRDWDYSPACSSAEAASGFYDQNGDGFCAYYVSVWGAEQFDLRAKVVR